MILDQKRIFLVEDNVQNKTIMQMLLEMQGAKVAIDRFGKETLSRLAHFMPVDAILLDLMLPNQVSGFDLITEIRTVNELRDVPIIAVSAMDPSIAIPRTKALGFAGFISKPIEFERFAAQIAEIIAVAEQHERPA